MHTYLKLLFLVLIGLNLIFCSWYVLHKDIYFQTDIARDFLLLQELDQKKIVLLGPRSSTSGLFHGPLWLYLNYPAFVIGQGNPIVMGWYWIFLISVFLLTSFVVAKKLFNEEAAYIATLLLSQMLIFEARALFNPHGAFFLLPGFFFFFIRTIETLKLKNLLIFLFLAGCIVQFQMAIGIPLLLLASIPLLYLFIKNHKKRYLFSFFILLIPFSTFIVFDMIHHFLQVHAVMTYVFNSSLDTHTYGNFLGLLVNRFQMVTSVGLGIIKDETGYKNLIIGLLFLFFVTSQIRANRFKTIYRSALYFYLGYYILSLINKSGGMLYHYSMPLYPLTILIFSSFITSKYKKVFLVLLAFVYVTNTTTVKGYIIGAKEFFGKDQNSWSFLDSMAQKVYQDKEKTLGYFLYMPDALAYQPKYAVLYESHRSDKTSSYFQKQGVTYLVIAPPPADQPLMKDQWWRVNQVKISTKPSKVISFKNGYKIEKYMLNDKEQKIPFDPSIDTGIHFR